MRDMSNIYENTTDFETYISKLRNEKTLIVCGGKSARTASIANVIASLKSNLDDVVVYSIKETLPYISARNCGWRIDEFHNRYQRTLIDSDPLRRGNNHHAR
ncbi:MAG: hypothetical protein ACJ0BV_00805 [Paracoccaceae bacterium]